MVATKTRVKKKAARGRQSDKKVVKKTVKKVDKKTLKKTVKKAAKKTQKKTEKPENTRSPYVVLRTSSIHNKGGFAKTDIPKGARVIEYVGEKITKAEADRRAEVVYAKAQKNQKKGAVYICILNSRYDIDGDVSFNTARYINHSCDPNCELLNLRGHMWIVARRKIKAGEELSYNYGYDFDICKDHPCRCGSPKCIGYILAREQWYKIRREREKKAAERAKKRKKLPTLLS